ncbi:MAG: FAD-dependent monooxygenase [Sphingobacterium sp.]|jgi:2-polyprenyl-6-methoxyphenol hydroxylase-like FAD-dependent oxidoreductase|nr:FAD-dependent monooxygenase [Sphingobacterium sp.]
MLSKKNIAIVGAGPGGLTLARLLQMKGVQVNVYDRDFSQAARVQGAIVDLHFDSGLKAIEAAGLLESFKAKYMKGADKYRLLDPYGNILMDENQRDKESLFGEEDFRPEIDRGALRDLLIDGLLPDTVVWDSQLISLQENEDTWELQFKNGMTTNADLVIGSDGYRSMVRPYLTDLKARYSGAAIIQGEIDHPDIACPEMYALVNQGNLMAMGDGASLVVQPRGDGGFTFYAASMYPENWGISSGINFGNTIEVSRYLHKHFANWNPIFLTLFVASETFTWRPLNYFPLSTKWAAKNNLTLIGDAAHLMPPNGEGVNLAMLDALDLCKCLTSGDHISLKEAITAYENIMFERAAPLCRETIDGIEDFAAPTNESVQELVNMLSPNKS